MSSGSSKVTGVAIVNPDFTLAWVDQPFATMLGHAPTALVGRSFADITHPQDMDLDGQLCNRLFRGEVEEYEMGKRYLHRDGSFVPVHLKVSLVRDRGGKVLYALSRVERVPANAAIAVRASAPLTRQEQDLDRIRRAVMEW